MVQKPVQSQYVPYEEPVVNGTSSLDPKLVLAAVVIVAIVGICAIVALKNNSKKGGK